MRIFGQFTEPLKNRVAVRTAIKNHTKITTNHLTPEIKLNLLSPLSTLWKEPASKAVFKEPFWAFYWAGGQALTRYVIDNSELFKNLRMLDFGSGCGATAIAASFLSDAVYANDIDPVACEAISMNSAMNHTKVHIIPQNVIETNFPVENFDCILVGDVFYDQDRGFKLLNWLQYVRFYFGTNIYVGDPGRYAFSQMSHLCSVKLLAEYDLLPHTISENSGFSTSRVWKLLH